jgi:NADH-quinone oxidoreductase subunit J
MSILFFYLIGAMILLSGIMAVSSRKIFRSAVWLLLSLTGIAALYFWMDLQFLAAVQIVVYIGGIVVLIIFSIFLTERSGADLPSVIPTNRAIALLISIPSFLILSWIILRNKFNVSGTEFDSSVNIIGKNMLSMGDNGFALPFEAVSVLLLAAMIGCIAIAIRKNPEKI